jgi:NAD(P)H-dependent flavin oxidoreductase YrpB (nitropropane dioxygenase family)
MAFAAGGALAAAVSRAGDPDNNAVWFGEAAGLIDTIEPAATIIERMVTDASNVR